jgi:subfamily B ATP-binding cassette protein HlyB/CyaB
MANPVTSPSRSRATIPMWSATDRAPAAGGPSPVATVRISIPDRDVLELPLQAGTYVIGRSEKAEISVPHVTVSRFHCSIDVSASGVRIRDLSSHGTFLTDQRVTDEMVVPWGQAITVGECRLVLQPVVVEAPAPAPRAAKEVPLTADVSVPEGSLLDFFAPADRGELLAGATRRQLTAEDVLTEEGAPADRLYVLLEGELNLTRGADQHAVGSVAIAGSVQLEAVLLGKPWNATTTCPDAATVLVIPEARLRVALQRSGPVAEYLRRIAEWPGADSFRHFATEYGIPRAEIVELVLSLEPRSFAAGAELTRSGQVPEGLFVINRGSVQGLKSVGGEMVGVSDLGPGAVFGGAESLNEVAISVSYCTTAEAELLLLSGAAIRSFQSRIPAIETFLNGLGSAEAQEEPAAEEFVDEHPDDEDVEAPPLEVFRRSKSKAPFLRASVKWVKQHDEMDCGAACVAMAARAYGRNISLASYRSMIHVTREGASMWSLVGAARKTGFEVAGVQTTVNGLKDIYLPAILLLRYHFVVVYKVTETHVIIGDPAIGVTKLTHDEFKQEWRGMALLLRPTKRLVEYPESKPGYRKYGLMLRGLWSRFAEVILAALLFFLFSLVTPVFTQITFDKVLVDGNKNLLNTLVVAMAVVMLFSQVTSVIRIHLTGFIANRFDTVFQALTYKHVMKLPVGFFMVRRVGDILTRFREISKIRNFLTSDTLNSIIQLFSVVIYLLALFLYSRKLGLIATAIVPLLALSSMLLARRLRKAFEKAFIYNAKAQGLVVEQMRALESLKAMNAELPSRWRMEEAMRGISGIRFKIDRFQILSTMFSSAVEQLATTLILYVAARMAMRDELTVGKVIASGQFISSIFAPVRELAGRWNTVQETQVALERVDDIITCAAEPADPVPRATTSATVEQPKLSGDIEFRDVWFQYGSDLSPWVLRGVNLTIREGETIAVVGRSGSGKTTLVQMINLLYRPTRGAIFINGTDTRQLPLSHVRGSIGMVMQDSQLFAGTVFENITLGDETPSLEFATAAARVANAHGFISNLAGGYYAELEEGGGGLSGGQRQRINIARALYRRPSILVLDEATSALDAESERAVVDSMKVFCKGRTSVIIAHRLTTILHADRVVLMDKGRVVEDGPHHELIRKGGPYARLFGSQLAL